MKIELDLTRDEIRDLILGLHLLKDKKIAVAKEQKWRPAELAMVVADLNLLEDRLMQHLR